MISPAKTESVTSVAGCVMYYFTMCTKLVANSIVKGLIDVIHVRVKSGNAFSNFDLRRLHENAVLFRF